MVFSSDNVRPSTVVNARDCGALVTIAASFSVTLCLIFYAARLLVRWPWRALFRHDDMVTSIATAFAIAQSILAMRSVAVGLGVVPADLDKASINHIDELVFSMQLLFIVIVFSCKVAACLLIHRLTCHGTQRICALAIIAASIVCCFISLMLVSVGLGGSLPWVNQQDEAETVTRRWIVYTTLTSLIDGFIVALAIALVYNLEMTLARKSKIVAVFGLRLGVIPISIVRVIRLSQALRSDVYNYDYVSVEVLTQAEMCYNVLSATLPSLSMFLASAHTGLLELGATDKMASTYGSASRRNGTPRATLRSGNRKEKNNRSSRGGGLEAFELTEQGHSGTSSAVTADKVQRNSLASDDSERAIIRVEKTVSLRYER